MIVSGWLYSVTGAAWACAVGLAALNLVLLVQSRRYLRRARDEATGR